MKNATSNNNITKQKGNNLKNDNPDSIIDNLMQENRSSQTIFALSEKDALNKLKDNDVLIFLNKITPNEQGFYQLLESFSKRGLFQLYDCITTLVVIFF